MPATTKQEIHKGLAVIIPYYDGAQFIEPCIKSIQENTILPEHLFIVDNDPQGIGAHFPSSHTLHIRILRTPPGIGFGRAVNVGIYHAEKEGCHLFLVLNQDTKLDAHCIQAFLQSYSTTDALRAISGMIKEYETDDTRVNIRNYLLSDIPNFKADDQADHVKPTYPIDRIFGECFMFDKTLVASTGLFDPVFKMYGEDTDLGNRILKAGGSLFLSTGAHVHHRHTYETALVTQHREILRLGMRAKLALRIRYTRLTRIGFIVRCIWFFVQNLMSRAVNSPSPFSYLGFIPYNLKTWKDLKRYDTNAVKQRITEFLKKDMIS